MAHSFPIHPPLPYCWSISRGWAMHCIIVLSLPCRNFPNGRIDWVVEDTFAALPPMHSGVKQTLTVAALAQIVMASRGEIKAACSGLSGRHFDLVLVTQGLLKRALIAKTGSQAVRAHFFDRRHAWAHLRSSWDWTLNSRATQLGGTSPEALKLFITYCISQLLTCMRNGADEGNM